MTKAKLVAHIAKDAGITKREAERVLESLMLHLKRALKKGERVTLVGFGTFSVSRRKAKMARVPGIAKSVRVSARRVARFKPGSALKAALAAGPHGPKPGPDHNDDNS